MRALTFRIGDIPVQVDPSFWIIMGLFGLSRASAQGGVDLLLVVEWIVLVFLGILVHELGHAVAFRAFGRPPSVVLYAMGGLTSAAGRLTPGRRLITTLAGPGVGFAIGAVVLGLRAAGIWAPDRLDGLGVGELLILSTGAAFVTEAVDELIFLDLLFINVGWGLLNLIPLHPLDGGQSLEALLDLIRVKGAALITSVIGVLVAAGAAWWSLQIGSVFLLLIMGFLGFINLRRIGALVSGDPPPKATAAATLSPELQRTVALAEQALREGREAEAVELLRQEHTYRPTPVTTRMYVALLIRTRGLDDLEQVLSEHHDQLDVPTLTSAAAALVAGGRYEVALRAAESAWNADPSDSWEPAVTAAAARAGLRDVDGAVRWLFTAADRGWTDRRRLEADPVFAEVRADPRMADVVARMRP